MRTKLHYDWHWIWNYGNGDLGNQGIHQMDIARRFPARTALSPKVWSVGGRLGYEDDGETPNSLFVFHDYEKAPLIFEVRGLPRKADAKEMDKYRGASVGVVVQYENGYIVAPDYNNAVVFDNEDKLIRKFGNPPMAQGHGRIRSRAGRKRSPRESRRPRITSRTSSTAVRSRKAADLNGKIIDGHISSALCHTGNISYRLGKNSDARRDAREAQGQQGSDRFARAPRHASRSERRGSRTSRS